MTEWLDELKEIRNAGTPGGWENAGRYRILVEGILVARAERTVDAALIVAAVNSLPKLTRALQTVLDLADTWERHAHAFDELEEPEAARELRQRAVALRAAVDGGV